MKAVMAAGALALGGLMSLGVGVANADEVEVEGSYATLAACQADGPHVEIARNDGAYSQWDCREGADGLFHLFLST